jgi:hypothetical protein
MAARQVEAKQRSINMLCIREMDTRKKKSCPRYIGGKGFVGEIEKALSNTKRESDDSTAR